MTPQFKFLRRVRIHGGECGAVARALHHEVKGSSLYQAASGKALESTFIERKQMSTKTTLKRAALVAVSALGIGLLSAVTTPASATSRTATSITVGTVPTCRVGALCSIPVTFNLPAGSELGDSLTVVAKVTSAPAASNSIGYPASGSVSAVSSTVPTSADIEWTNATSGSGLNSTFANSDFNEVGQASDGSDNWANAKNVTTAGLDLPGQITLNLKFNADADGKYTIIVATVPVTVGANAAGRTAAGVDAAVATLAGYTSSSFSITTSASPSTVTLTNVGGGSVSGASSVVSGALVKISGAVLSGSESLVLTGSTSTITFSDSTITASELVNGTAWINVYNSAAETASITVSQGGTLTGLTSTSLSIKWTAYSTQFAPTLGFSSTDTTLATCTGTCAADTDKDVSTARATQTVRASFDNSAGTADKVTFITVTDTDGKVSGKAATSWSVPVTFAAADTVGYVDVSVTGTLADEEAVNFTLYTSSTTADTASVQGETATETTAAIYPAIDGVRSSSTFTSVTVATASTNTYFARITDQFGAAVAGSSVTITHVGRNAKVQSTAVTDASGYVSYAVTDTGTSGTTDTITFTDGSATKALTVTYGTATVTTLTLTGGDTTAGVTSTTKSIKDIDGDSSGAEDGTQTITATLKDSTGALMGGIPVTWSVAGTGVAITSTQKLKYSGSTGTATTTVYAWLAGTYTVTATAGGATATAEITFGQTTTTDARVLSATVSGSTITAKVVDRFGNVIPGVTVYASRVSGTGFFGSGVTKTSTTTGTDGLAEFIVSGGDTKVKVSVVSYDAAAGTTFGQTCAAAGKVDCPTDGTAATAFTAATVGTASTAETFVGSTYSPAGVESVTLDVTVVNAAANAAEAATDAAAEAIDAANAATDAANLAAEAADAATVAAEEARDAADAATAAVEELATQVATLMAALKAQITTLANTVAKIAKKVKA